MRAPPRMITALGVQERTLKLHPSLPTSIRRCVGDRRRPKALRGGTSSQGFVRGRSWASVRDARILPDRELRCAPGLGSCGSGSWQGGDREVAGGEAASGSGAGITETAHPSLPLTWDFLSPCLCSGRYWGCRRRCSPWAARSCPVGLVCKTWTRPHPRARPALSPSWMVTFFFPTPAKAARHGFQGQRKDLPRSRSLRSPPRMRAPVYGGEGAREVWLLTCSRRRTLWVRETRQLGALCGTAVCSVLSRDMSRRFAFLIPDWNVLFSLPVLGPGCNHIRTSPLLPQVLIFRSHWGICCIPTVHEILI